MKINFFIILLITSSCTILPERNENNPFYDPAYCNSTLIDNDDYCSDRYYPKRKPLIIADKPKDDSKDVPAKQPDNRSEGNKTSSPKEDNSRDFGVHSRSRGD